MGLETQTREDAVDILVHYTSIVMSLLYVLVLT
jgi:hypothetical protein